MVRSTPDPRPGHSIMPETLFSLDQLTRLPFPPPSRRWYTVLRRGGCTKERKRWFLWEISLSAGTTARAKKRLTIFITRCVQNGDSIDTLFGVNVFPTVRAVSVPNSHAVQHSKTTNVSLAKLSSSRATLSSRKATSTARMEGG